MASWNVGRLERADRGPALEQEAWSLHLSQSHKADLQEAMGWVELPENLLMFLALGGECHGDMVMQGQGTCEV